MESSPFEYQLRQDMMAKPQFDAKIVSMITMSSVILKSSGSLGWKRLIVYYVPVPPLAYITPKAGPLIGNDVEIWNTMAKHLNVKITYVPEWSFNVLTNKVSATHLNTV